MNLNIKHFRHLC